MELLKFSYRHKTLRFGHVHSYHPMSQGANSVPQVPQVCSVFVHGSAQNIDTVEGLNFTSQLLQLSRKT